MILNLAFWNQLRKKFGAAALNVGGTKSRLAIKVIVVQKLTVLKECEIYHVRNSIANPISRMGFKVCDRVLAGKEEGGVAVTVRRGKATSPANIEY